MRSLVVLLALFSVSWAGVRHPHFKIAGRNGVAPAVTTQPFNPTVDVLPLYGIDTSDSNRGAGQVIGIIDAYGASTAESDLAAFSRANGLPAANFQKVDQNGGTNYPKDDPDDASGDGWGVETALDLQIAHAVAPAAKLILCTAKSASDTNLNACIKTLTNLHVNHISMSYGGSEGDTSSDSYFQQAQEAGISLFASAGDSGAEAEYPAASQYVVAVGGTTLHTNSDGSFNSETAWSGSGGGCSKYTKVIPEQNADPGYASLGCKGKKALPDLAALADPNSGITIIFHGQELEGIGGTSLAAPLTAGRAAIRGDQVTPAYVYTGGIQFRDITQGSNGHSAKAGLDLVTGEGAWIGSE
uniref:PHP protein n=2 Tax=Physarum polycephalum TaxID=5791 RepID=Q94704_PHYPO|nr:PHP [Physarum polycephalum]